MRTLCGAILAAAIFSATLAEERCAAFSLCDLDFKCVWRGRSVFNAEMPFPDGVSFVPSAHYRAEVSRLPAEMRIVDAEGNVIASFAAPTNVAPPYTMHLSVDGMRSAAVFATKCGDTRFVRYDKWPKGFDPRKKIFLRKLSVCSDGGMSPVASSLSAGVGQADVRFVTRGREGALYIEGGRLFFTFSARHGSACAVGSIDPAKPSDGWRLEGSILFDYGDGLLRNDLAPHIFLDDESGEWRGWACNFSTGAETGGRARGGVNAAEGIDFSDISFDRTRGTLKVSVPAKPGVKYTVKFITTKIHADVEPIRTVAIPAKGDRPVRNLPVYSDEIGAVVKSVSFGAGKDAVASYALAPDDLYIRARVESDEPAVYPNALAKMHPPTKTAWTQPYRRERGRIVRYVHGQSEDGGGK